MRHAIPHLYRLPAAVFADRLCGDRAVPDFRGRMGKSWWFSLAGFLSLSCGTFLQFGLQIWLHVLGGLRDYANLTTVFNANWFAQTFFNALGMICILIAIFAGRTSGESKGIQ